MDRKEKLARANKLYDEATALLMNEEATAEEKARIPEMMEDARKLQAEAMQLKEIEEAGARLLKEAEEEQGPEENKEERQDPHEFKEWGEFLESAYYARHPDYRGKRDERLQWFKEDAPEDSKQMTEQTGVGGGFLVPVEFSPEMQAAVAEQAIVRSRATIIRMRRRSVQIPVLDQTATGVVGQPGWFGGMVFAWGAEALEKAMTEAEFNQVEMVAHKLYGYTRASNELVADSAISLGDFLSGPMGLSGGIAFMEDYAFLVGTGAGQPLGVITAVNQPTIVVARQTAGQINIADLANMRQRFLPSARGVWVATQEAMSGMIQMAGPAGNPAYWWQISGRDDVPDVLLGWPLFWSEKVPGLGLQGDIGLFDFNYYLLGDRQATTVESTEYDRWAWDQTSWRAVHRVCGQPWLRAPLTYMNQTMTVSPFVILGDATGS